MPTRVLVVEDDPRRAARVLALLEAAGFDASTARHALEGPTRVDQEGPDAFVIDLGVSGPDDFAMVESIRSRHPAVPVILVGTAGGAEIATPERPQEGSIYDVAWGDVEGNLIPTLSQALESAAAGRARRRLLDCWAGSESRYLLDNDPALIPPLIAHLAENLARLRICAPTTLIRVHVALSEALTNAIFHGNLELDSALREGDERPFDALAERRRVEAPYRDRRVEVIERATPSRVVYVIRDEGPGFDISKLPDPDDPSSLERPSGRGLQLIRSFMDDVRHNPSGNEITMIKDRDRGLGR